MKGVRPVADKCTAGAHGGGVSFRGTGWCPHNKLVKFAGIFRVFMLAVGFFQERKLLGFSAAGH